ncbi:MAG TPA: periplasmic heavy metal sensor [Micropepsaceae bacterium]|nr:periplasmic heavy metal sensor [Micropepsaceae bacterium]
MRGQWRTFFVMLLLTVIAAGFAGWAGVQYGVQKSMPNTDLDAVLHHDLDLTADQDRQMRILEQNFASDRGSLQAEMRAANRELARAITEKHVYGPDARRAIDRFHAAMASLQEKTVQHVLAMRAVLTPSQTARFDETIDKALGAEAP